jgi:hypothetical protein
MAYALVGTIGAVSVGAAVNTAVTPAWGTSENRTANNLLICWVAGSQAATFPTTPSGWSIGVQRAGTSCSSTVYYKVATGADAAPTIAAVSATLWSVQLGEFSGGPSLTPTDQSAGNSGTSSPLVATAGAVDRGTGDLLIGCAGLTYGSSRAPTLTPTFNNATATAVNDGATSRTNHYGFAYGVGTTNASADTFTLTYTTTQVTGAAVGLVSFRLPPSGAVSMSGTAALQVIGPGIQLVQQGPIVTSAAAATSVSPTFNQPTMPGHLLIALVGDYGSTFAATTPTCSDPTWSATDSSYGQVWYKANCGANETLPTWTFRDGTTYIRYTTLLEFAGMATSSPLDQFGLFQQGNVVAGGNWTVACSAADSQAGDLIVSSCQDYGPSASYTQTSSDSYNNAPTAITLGNNDATSTRPHYRFSYGITTTNASADSITHINNQASNSGTAISVVSFKPPPPPSAGSVTTTFTATATGTVVLSATTAATTTFTATAAGSWLINGFNIISQGALYNNTNGIAATSSFTPPVGAMLVVSYIAFAAAAGTTTIADNFGDTGGGTWAPVTGSVLTTASTFGTQYGAWSRLIGTGASAGQVTATLSNFAGGSESMLCVDQVTSSSGALSVPQGNCVTASFVATGSVSLASAPLSSSLVWSAAGCGHTGQTPVVTTSEFTQLDLINGGGGSPQSLSQATAYIATSGPTTTAWSGLNNGQANDLIAVEIAVGLVTVPATGTVSGTFSGTATGTWRLPGTASISGTFTATATGIIQVPGTGSSIGAFAGTAIGTLAATGALITTFTGTATGRVIVAATGSLATTFTGNTTGVWSLPASAGVAGTFTASAAGSVGITGPPPTYASTVLADGPVFYWRLNELTGTTAADATGNGLVGTYGPGVVLDEPPAVQDGTSVFVPQAGDGISVPNFPAAQTYPFSVEMWVNVQYTAYWGTLFAKVTDTGWGTGFGLFSIGDPTFKFWVGGYSVTGVTFSLPMVVAPGTWTHLVATYDGTTGNIYLNGALVNSGPIASTNLSNTASLWFGEDGNGYGWQGLMDEIAFYNFVLSPTRIATHYTVGTTQVIAASLTTSFIASAIGTETSPATGSASTVFVATAVGRVVFPSTAGMAGSFLASATGAWVPMALGSGSVLGTFAASATGVVVFSVPGGLTGIFAATATGTSRLPGTGTAIGTFTASGTGLVTVAATGAMVGTFTASGATTGSGTILGAFAATSVGLVVVPSHATLTGTFAATAAGALAGSGTASGSFTASAQGASTGPGAGTFLGTFTGLATGTMTPVDLGTASLVGNFLGQGTGVVTVSATAAMIGSFLASATGTWRIPATGTATGSFTALATGLVTVASTATALGTFAGFATGSIPGLALGTGAIVGTFSASGTGLVRVPSMANAIGIFAANATSVIIGPFAATGPLVTTFTGSASGISALPGHSSLVSTFTASAAGAINKIGSASLVISFMATATGVVHNLGSGLALGTFVASAAGILDELGSGMVVSAFLATATGVMTDYRPISSLVDNFDSGLDTTVWDVNDPAWGLGGDAIVHVVNGQLNITVGTGGVYGGIQCFEWFNLAGSEVIVQLVDAGNQALLSSHDVWPIWVVDTNGLGFGCEVQNGMMWSGFPAGINGPTFPYDPNVHRWFRIRELDGIFYEEYSPDRVNWTTMFSHANTFGFVTTAVQLSIQAGTPGMTEPQTTAVFDNVNTAQASLSLGRMAGVFRAKAEGFISGPTPSWEYINRSESYNYSDGVLAKTPEAKPVDVSFSDAR